MTVLPSPEAMIVICTVILIAYTAHVLDKAFASSEQFEAMLKARERIMGLRAENAQLRELVLTLAFCANDEADCDQCPMNGVRCDVVQQCFCDGAAETLREPGIKVDA